MFEFLSQIVESLRYPTLADLWIARLRGGAGFAIVCGIRD